MAEQEKSKPAAAIEQLRQAEQAYEKLVHLDVSNMKDKSGHALACRNALEAKKAAQKIVRDIEMGCGT